MSELRIKTEHKRHVCFYCGKGRIVIRWSGSDPRSGVWACLRHTYKAWRSE